MVSVAVFFWDPNPEVFTLPFLHLPILWYGLCFALGFIVGFPIFVSILERFFIQKPYFEEREILGDLQIPGLQGPAPKGPAALIHALNEWLVSPAQVLEPILPRKKALFGWNSLHSQEALRRLKLEQLFPKALLSLHKQAVMLTDRLVIYLVIATVVGARVGHYLFYENPSDYLEIFAIWQMRGLASHGAAIAIVLATALFAYRYRAKLRGMTWLHLLDFVCVPTALAGACIRLGNFFNQEILGTPTSVSWAVIFGHPADGSWPVPRHPVQLYEALGYLAIFFFLWRSSFAIKYILGKGRLLGWFLVLVFGLRFVVEFWKEEQSRIMPDSLGLTMGQLLSIPAILVGLFLLFYSARRSS